MDQPSDTPTGAPPGAESGPQRSVFVPAPEVDRTNGSAPSVPGGVAEEPSRGKRRRWLVPTLMVPLVVAVVLVIAWAVDTSSGGVARNVTLAGRDVGDLSESQLAREVRALADDFAAVPVEVVSGDSTYSTTTSEIGLMVDQDETAASALEVDDGTLSVLRPVAWVGSFFSEREAPVRFQVSREQASATIVELQGDDRTPPTEPTVEIVEGTFEVVPGASGRGIDPDTLSSALTAAATDWDVGEDLRVEVPVEELPPLGSEDEAQDAADRAEALVAEPLEVRTSAGARTIAPDELRAWATLASQDDGSVLVELAEDRVADGLRRHFADIEGAPVDASFTLGGDGLPVIVPDRPGLVCCGEGAAERIIEVLGREERVVDLELVEGPASFTVADAEAWKITQPVGGNNAWLNGAPTTAAPGFTTYHAPGGARVVNIHLMADLVRGAVVAPGDTFSLNERVGRRTAEKGFLPAGAISEGRLVEEVGGGVSQFATTMFNAAYFAGLEIVTSQAHSQYFDRYPLGREATMGYPQPDLVFRNDTPYGILIWTSYTDTSLTVTLYSTPYATAEQTGISESQSGRCRVVTTTRTRTFPDGRTDQDTFRATYRPGDGISC